LGNLNRKGFSPQKRKSAKKRIWKVEIVDNLKKQIPTKELDRDLFFRNRRNYFLGASAFLVSVFLASVLAAGLASALAAGLAEDLASVLAAGLAAGAVEACALTPREMMAAAKTRARALILFIFLFFNL